MRYLAPCPFCGSQNLREREAPRDDENEQELVGPASVSCLDCQGGIFGFDLEEAQLAWNRRFCSSPSDDIHAVARRIWAELLTVTHPAPEGAAHLDVEAIALALHRAEARRAEAANASRPA